MWTVTSIMTKKQSLGKSMQLLVEYDVNARPRKPNTLGGSKHHWRMVRRSEYTPGESIQTWRIIKHLENQIDQYTLGESIHTWKINKQLRNQCIQSIHTWKINTHLGNLYKQSIYAWRINTHLGNQYTQSIYTWRINTHLGNQYT